MDLMVEIVGLQFNVGYLRTEVGRTMKAVDYLDVDIIHVRVGIVLVVIGNLCLVNIM